MARPRILPPQQVVLEHGKNVFGREWWRFFQQQSSALNNASIIPLVFQIVGVPGAGQTYNITIAQSGSLLGTAGTAFAFIGTSPTATESLTLKTLHPTTSALGVVIPTTLGVVQVSTAGIVTFPLFGNVALQAGDTVQLKNENPADATFADSCFTFQYSLG